MAKWEQLIAARENLHLSQLEAAGQLNVGLVTYQRWETGRTKPQPQHMRRLYKVFGTLLEHGEQTLSHQLSSQTNISLNLFPAAPAMSDFSKHLPVAAPEEENDEARAFIASHMITHLWSLTFLDHPTCKEKRSIIRGAIEEFDAMNSSNKNYQMTRREALCALATLPMITFGLSVPGKTVSSTQYGGVLAQCAASIEACWELSKSSNAGDFLLAFKAASKYRQVLETVAKNSSQYRKEALDLAARYALIKTVLGWHCASLAETVQFAKEAVAFSKETSDPSLQLSAYSKLAWAYFYEKKYTLALATAQEAEKLLQQYQRLPNAEPLPSCIQGGTYSTLALMQAKNGKSPEIASGKAIEVDPGNEPYAFMEFTRADIPLETGQTYCYWGNQAKAMEALEQIVDPATLATKELMSERGRLDVIRLMALSSLRGKGRDIEKTIYFWTMAMESAKALQSEWGFNEMLTIYELMEAVWPEENRIIDLRDLIAHW